MWSYFVVNGGYFGSHHSRMHNLQPVRRHLLQVCIRAIAWSSVIGSVFAAVFALAFASAFMRSVRYVTLTLPPRKVSKGTPPPSTKRRESKARNHKQSEHKRSRNKAKTKQKQRASQAKAKTKPRKKEAKAKRQRRDSEATAKQKRTRSDAQAKQKRPPKTPPPSTQTRTPQLLNKRARALATRSRFNDEFPLAQRF